MLIENPFAFPCGYHPSGNSADQGGMTLRDYFAAKVIGGHVGTIADTHGMSATQVALQAYEIADAMLTERAKGVK